MLNNIIDMTEGIVDLIETPDSEEAIKDAMWELSAELDRQKSASGIQNAFDELESIVDRGLAVIGDDALTADDYAELLEVCGEAQREVANIRQVIGMSEFELTDRLYEMSVL